MSSGQLPHLAGKAPDKQGARGTSAELRAGGGPGAGQMCPRRGMLEGPWGGTTLLRFVVLGGSCGTRALSLTLRSRTPAWLRQEEARSCRAGAGDKFFPLVEGAGRGMRWNGTATPACRHGGSDPQPSVNSQRRCLPLTCQALQTKSQRLLFALERDLEAFWLQKRCARVRSIHPSCASKAHVPPAAASRPRGREKPAFGHGELKRTPEPPSLPHLWVQMRAERGLCRGLSSLRSGGSAAHCPVPAVVLYLQQGLVSKSSLKWLCLSSLLLYEVKQKQKTTPNNYKYKDSHAPDTCSLRDS